MSLPCPESRGLIGEIASFQEKSNSGRLGSFGVDVEGVERLAGGHKGGFFLAPPKQGWHKLPEDGFSRCACRRAQSRAKSDTRDIPLAEPFAMSAAIQVSHLHITDRATEAAVRILSYYEMAGLRRRAEYGDDSAAFQMGMAYEIGRGVPQRCTTAAQWVARAAGEDNAAAQYNLGLRYRDGDGVAVDEDEAVKWLQKAVSKQNSDAKVALGALIAHQTHVVPSSQTSH